MPRPSKSPTRLSVLALEAREVPAALTYEEWRNTPVHVGEETNTAAEVPAGPVANWMEGNTQIGLDQAFASYPYRGAGYAVAVLDTGINYNHPALGGGWGNRVKAGYDFVNNDADPMDDNGHGTHVAGIIGSSNATYNGVAPDVNLIALKVLGASGSGSYGAVEQALQWVIANRAAHNIVAINLSLGSGNYNSNPYTFLDDEFTTLKNAGVFLAVAAGNSFYSYGSAPGLAYPAVSPLVASVGAVWTGNVGGASWGSGAQDYTTGTDRITSFSQRNANLGIMAPGARLTSTGVGGNFVAMSGTSMAAPVVAGAAALLRQAADATGQPALANQDAILNLMRTTGATVIDGDDENDNVTNTGLSFKRLNVKGALDQIAISANNAPVIAAIADQTMTPKQVRTLTLSATDADGDAVTFSAAAAGVATPEYQLKQQYGLHSTGNYYTNQRGAGEKYLQGTGGAWYFILPDGKFYRWNSTISDGTLLTTVSTAIYANPALLTGAAAPAAPNATVSVSGNQLTIDPADTWAGTFQVTVTATDGKTPATRTFLVTVANQAPTLAAVADQTMGSRQDTLTLTLSGSDADGDTLTYSASVASSNSQAYQLDQLHGLYFGGNYYLNMRGANEKYLRGNGGAWYFLLSDGKLYKWNSTISDGTLLATLTPAIYADPSLLYNAPAPTGGNVSATATLNGTTLTLDPVAGQSGAFTVNVSASDGLATATRSFVVTVLAGTPTLATVADQAMSPSQGSIAIDLAGSDPDGDALTYSATVAGGNSQAYQLDQQHGLYTAGNYYTNQRGAGEKYLQGTGGAWYFILPDGRFYQWGTTISDGTLLATLSPSLYADPSLLHNAPAGGGPAPATASVSGNRVTVTPNAGYTGTFAVTVTVSDGQETATRTFNLTVANRAPTLAAIADQGMSPSQSSLTLTLNAADPDADTLTYTLSAAGGNSLAYQMKQQHGLYFGGNLYTNLRGANEKYVQGTGGAWFFLLPDGRFYRWNSTISDGTLLATFDATYHADPSRLYNATAGGGAAPATVTRSSNQLTIVPTTGYTGTFVVTVSISDGSITTTRTFNVTVANQAPTLVAIADQTMSAGQDSMFVDLVASDPDGEAVTYTAQVSGTASQAAQLKQQYGLYTAGNLYLNLRGANEKYLQGTGGAWFFILPDGRFYQWGTTIANSTLLTTLPVNCYTDPSLIYNAPAPVTPTVALSFSGNRLTIDPAAGTTGSFVVTVTASDGTRTTTRSFTVAIT